MTTSEANTATQRIQFRYYAYLAGPMGDVFQFLLRNKAHTHHNGKKMALDAISAFWKPFSARAVLKVSEEEAKIIARDSVDKLQRQIDLIKNAFDLQPYTRGITKSEVEAMIDSRLNQELRLSPETSAAATVIPIPDSYNIQKR